MAKSILPQALAALKQLGGVVADPSVPRRMKLRPIRRLDGLCLYCGRPTRSDVCGFCSHLPVRDPLVSKARLPLSEQERMKAAG